VLVAQLPRPLARGFTPATRACDIRIFAGYLPATICAAANSFGPHFPAAPVDVSVDFSVFLVINSGTYLPHIFFRVFLGLPRNGERRLVRL